MLGSLEGNNKMCSRSSSGDAPGKGTLGYYEPAKHILQAACDVAACFPVNGSHAAQIPAWCFGNSGDGSARTPTVKAQSDISKGYPGEPGCWPQTEGTAQPCQLSNWKFFNPAAARGKCSFFTIKPNLKQTKRWIKY